jgi:hypothetical protein
MAGDKDIAAALLAIETEMRRLLDGQTPPYDAGWAIWAKAMAFVSPSPDVMHPLWLIWGALTDWVENRPEETSLAELKMRQAAKEWLEVNHNDATQEKEYLDRWVYDEMGYARNGE